MKLNQELLKQIVDYDPKTGILVWKPRSHTLFNGKQKEKSAIRWNASWAGKEAFTAINSDGYKQGSILGNQYKSQRIIWLWWYGKWPNYMIDHIDGDYTNNRLSNLRDVPRLKNQQNMKKPINNTSGTIGVCFDISIKKWKAYIYKNRKRIHLGSFTNLEEAAKCRKLAEKEYGFHENHGR